jgi:hypothetical protein
MTPGFPVPIRRKAPDSGELRAGEDCPHCNEAKLRNLDSSNLICPSCYSTYPGPDPEKVGVDAGLVIYWIVCGLVTLLICMFGLSVIYTILAGEG